MSKNKTANHVAIGIGLVSMVVGTFQLINDGDFYLLLIGFTLAGSAYYNEKC